MAFTSCRAVIVDASIDPKLGPVPNLGEDDVLIKVAYAGVNRPDVMQRKGQYPPPPGDSPLLGLEVSGRIVSVGSSVKHLKEGDEVCALTPGGGYSELCLAPQGNCLPLPRGLGLREAAALPENYFTVWFNVFVLARLLPGENILIHGGTSGIGTAAIQLARAMGARKIFTTVGSAKKAEEAKALGADHVVLYGEEDFEAKIKEINGKDDGLDVILDMVGGDYVNKNIRLLRTGGRHVSIAFQKGSKMELDLMPVMMKKLELKGSTMRRRTREEKAEIARSLKDNVWPLLESGRVKPVICAEIPMAEAARAHALLESGQVIGKVLLKVSDD
ncbi:hypothetical protein GUITHDRAFT_112897 [Guillardia theta CCMP2712]|uniref:Enoyl reductase (ER) domain-containing protein n=1 Tax=Guillardia theta (strain CCMP2712) TaxID=905079 RepID=L1IY08_GUITC|nr:hypothetical protein GUITHDRAFT_112897 [Guillardia theta CCMP2712]EKX41158.1 hypothetical protein GUITHDRAFT_112897 [Guillardia theta CCMP2712]|eukprot:XP_005828138.1 hypothetical protein GUITHDRAFT_112897 [Guillardia theta CCMP2712]